MVSASYVYLQPLACPRPSFTPVQRILCWPCLALTHLWPILFVWLWPSLTSVWLVFGPPSPQFSSSSAHAASPQFSFSWAQPHLNSASLGPSLTSIQLLLCSALPQFGSSAAQPCPISAPLWLMQPRLSLAPLRPSFASVRLTSAPQWLMLTCIATNVCCIGQTPFAIDKAAAQLYDLTFLIAPLTNADVNADTTTITTLHPHPLGHP